MQQQLWLRAVELLVPLSQDNYGPAARLAAAVLPHCDSVGIDPATVRALCAFALAHCPEAQVGDLPDSFLAAGPLLSPGVGACLAP